MKFILALKAFCKAWKNPKKAESFLNDDTSPKAETADLSHLRLLSLLQHSGRLIDFLKEDISTYNDAQVGAAVRQIHSSCAKNLEELVTLRPVLEEAEGSIVNVPAGYDPMRIKVVGKVKGEPPFTGVLMHKGWKAHKRSLPQKSGEQISDVICPAEIEVR
ncbi:MAG: DUF2760 domain-containing protein [Parachlamydiaceae bacterium]|nr:DUF2760 domain-containing protein [Parachlamydiaceae bacterium]